MICWRNSLLKDIEVLLTHGIVKKADQRISEAWCTFKNQTGQVKFILCCSVFFENSNTKYFTNSVGSSRNCVPNYSQIQTAKYGIPRKTHFQFCGSSTSQAPPAEPETASHDTLFSLDRAVKAFVLKRLHPFSAVKSLSFRQVRKSRWNHFEPSKFNPTH